MKIFIHKKSCGDSPTFLAFFLSFFLSCRELLSVLNGAAPCATSLASAAAATAVLNNKNNRDSNADNNNSKTNLMTQPNGCHTSNNGVSSPTASIENPSNLTAHTPNEENPPAQDVQQEKDLQKTTTTTTAAAAVTTKATASPQQRPPASAASPSTSRLAIIKASGVPLGGRTAAQGGPSKYRGVVWHKSNSKWEARIYEAGKQRFLGYFSKEDEAALTYDDYAACIHGTSSKINFPHSYAGVTLPRPTRAAAYCVRQHAPSGTRSTTTAAAAAHMNNQNCANEAGVIEASLDAEKAFTHHQAHPHQRRGGKGGGAMRVLPVKGSSRFRGVSWNSNCHKWRSQAWKGAEVHHLGYFEFEEDAAQAYDQAVLRIRGPNAPTNYPRSHYGVYLDDEEGGERHGQYIATSNAGFQSLPQYNGGKTVDGGADHITKKHNSGNSNNVDKDAFKNSPSSNMLGVSWSDSHKAWISEIWDGKSYQLLGTFTTEAEAAKAYDLACLAQHGSDALTNYPLDNYAPESAAVALLGISHDPHGCEELYGDEDGGTQKRSVTPPAQASIGGSSRGGKHLHQQQKHDHHPSNELYGRNNSNTASPKRQTVVVHDPSATDGASGKRRAVTPTPLPLAPLPSQKGSHGDGESLSLPPWQQQQQQQQQHSASIPAVSFRAAPAPAATSVPEAAPSGVDLEKVTALYGHLQKCIAQQQQRQASLPVFPMQSSAPPAGEAPEQQQPVVLSENAQHALMVIMQAALDRQQQQQQHAALAAAAAANASWEQERYASQQRLEVAAAIQNWANARQHHPQIHLAPAPPAISLKKRDFSNFSSAGNNNNNNNTNGVTAAYRALLAHHQMNAAAAKRPRV